MLQELRRENLSMCRELDELRQFRYDTLEKQKSEARTSSVVSQENDLAFRKLLEENLPMRKDRSRSRRPTYPGSSAPTVNLFSGHEKKQFSKAIPKWCDESGQESSNTLLGEKNSPKMMQSAGNAHGTAAHSNARAVDAAHSRGRRPTRESLFSAQTKGTSEVGKPTYAAALVGKDYRKTKSEAGDVPSPVSPSKEWPLVAQVNGSKNATRSRSKERIARRRSKELEVVELSTPLPSATTLSAIKGYNGPVIVDGSGRKTSNDDPQAASATKTFAFNPCANDFNFSQKSAYDISNPENYQWYSGFEEQNYPQQDIPFEYQHPTYYSPPQNRYEYEQTQYPVPDYQDGTNERHFPHDGLQPEHQLEHHYLLPDEAQYMTQDPTQEQYGEYDAAQSQQFHDQTVEYDDCSIRQNFADATELWVEETGAVEGALELNSKPEQQQSVDGSTITVDIETDSIRVSESEDANTVPIVSIQELRRFNWADDSSEEGTLVNEPQYPIGKSVALTNTETSKKQGPVTIEIPPGQANDKDVDHDGGEDSIILQAGANLQSNDFSSRNEALEVGIENVPEIEEITAISHDTEIQDCAVLGSEASVVKVPAVDESPALTIAPASPVPLVEKEKAEVENEENQWMTVERSTKHGRQSKRGKAGGSAPPSGTVTPNRKPSAGSSWASIASASAALVVPHTPTKKAAVAVDFQQKSDSPGSATGGIPQDCIKMDAKRKLYLSDVPKETTYAELLRGIKGGLIDDVYLSSQSPDRHQHHQMKVGRPKPEKSEPCFAYVTFFSQEGAQRCIEYLRHIDGQNSNEPWRQVGPYMGFRDAKPVAHITLSGRRVAVYCRERDQRILQRDVLEAVQLHQGTRILIFTFRKNIRIKPPHTGNSSKWDTWQKALSRENGIAGMEMIKRHIQIWKNTPSVDVESIELLPTITESPATKKPSRVPKLFLGAPADQTFTIRVSLVRISVALKVKQVLEQDIMFKEHCNITFAPDPCAEPFIIAEPTAAQENSNTIQGDDMSESTPATPTKSRKKKKKLAAIKVKNLPVEDSEVFPPLPHSVSGTSASEVKTPTSATLWTSKELPLAVKTGDPPVMNEADNAEKSTDISGDEETKSAFGSQRSVSSANRAIPIFGDIEAINTANEQGTVDMPTNRKGKKWSKVEI
ncbi:hypothetical protein BDD12DRAFT_912983 [Trichophaea hybrida]|nr:hypothetical protein BDD12DRAFT_912983 [Trichophaea hybrida]